MFWPFLVAGTAISLALTKLGALIVMVTILTLSLKIVSVLLIFFILAAVIYFMWQNYHRNNPK